MGQQGSWQQGDRAGRENVSANWSIESPVHSCPPKQRCAPPCHPAILTLTAQIADPPLANMGSSRRTWQLLTFGGSLL